MFGPDERLDNIPLLPDLTFIFRLANLLHIDTKEEVIRRELLVKEGDPADPFLLEESERNLRALPYIRQVKVGTVPVSPDEVDVIVVTQDTWTTQPRASFGFGGGTHRTSFGLVETNLLGYGKRVRLIYRTGLDRTTSLFEYDDPRVLGSRWSASGDYQDTSDGRVAEGVLEYPFFSLETQSVLWTIGYGMLVALVAACGLVVWRAQPTRVIDVAPAAPAPAPAPAGEFRVEGRSSPAVFGQ